MKAIKLTKIKWNTEGVSDEIKNNLPSVKGFLADDNFDICTATFRILKNKYGVDAKTFNFKEYRVAQTLEDILLYSAPKTAKIKNLWTSKNELSAFGKLCYNNLRHILDWNIVLRRDETPENKIPKVVDEVLLGIERVLGIDPTKSTIQEIMKEVDSKVRDMKYVNLKDEDEKEKEKDGDEE